MVDRFANIANESKQKHFDKLNEYRNKLIKEPDLKQLFIEMTLNCNEHCLHCGSNCSINAETDKPLSDLEIINFLLVLKKQLENDKKRLPFLDVTGGEPMLRPNFITLMSTIRELGYKWGMTSNGLLIDEKSAQALKDAGMSSVAISLDGLEDTHNWFRQNKNAYKLALRAIRCLSKLSFKDVMVTTVVNSRNINELDEIKKIVLSTGCSTWRIISLDPIGRALKNKDIFINEEQYKYMIDYIVKQRELDDINVIYGCNYYLGLNYERKTRPWYYMCQAGITVGGLQYNGNISACLDIERRPDLIFGNIRKDDFYDKWKNEFKIFRQNKELLSSKCSKCKAKNNCHGGGWHTWDFDKDEPRVCMYEILND